MAMTREDAGAPSITDANQTELVPSGSASSSAG